MERSSDGIEKLHPLLMPSIFSVLLKHIDSEDLYRCREVEVCKGWNTLIRKKITPLLIPKILGTVIKHLPHSTLGSARLVCSLWNRMIIQSKTWVEPDPVFGESEKVTFFKAGYAGVGTDDFRRFKTKFGDPADLPLPLCFSHFVAPNNLSLGDPNTQDFLRTYGQCIKLLKLYRCKWDLESLRQTLFEFTPNLEHFDLTCGIITGTQVGKGKKMVIPELNLVLHDDPADFPILPRMKSIQLDMNILDSKDNPRAYVIQFLVELFNSCPNLQKLRANMTAWYARTWLTDLIATNETICLKNLKVLDHIIDPDLSKIINLQMKQFPLTTLKVRIRYRDVTLEALHELFISLKHTLTSLQLIFLEYKCAHEFPSSQELYKLKHFELWKYKGRLDFLKDFASLEDLLLGEIELKSQALFNQRDIFNVLLPNLKKITFKEHWETVPFS